MSMLDSPPALRTSPPRDPPSRPPPMAATLPPKPKRERWNEERYPLLHRIQRNSNWYPSWVERSPMLLVKDTTPGMCSPPLIDRPSRRPNPHNLGSLSPTEIGRASCRERV